jgi:hypothetical protein
MNSGSIAKIAFFLSTRTGNTVHHGYVWGIKGGNKMIELIFIHKVFVRFGILGHGSFHDA